MAIFTLTSDQAENAVREYLADPGEGVIAVHLPPSEPIRLASKRGGGLTVYTGEDSGKPPIPVERTGESVSIPNLEPDPRIPPEPPLDDTAQTNSLSD